MVGVEINMVLKDSLKALALYEKIFHIERVEVTNLQIGNNEVVFKLYDARFHLLDENPTYHMLAPKPENPQPIWFNILVPNIVETYEKAMQMGCNPIQEVIENPDFGLANAVFSDPFGYTWMLHEMHKAVSLEERVELWKDDIKRH